MAARGGLDPAQERKRIRKLKQYEEKAYKEGFCRIAGLDEAGRGPIAGPVVAAGVILARDFYLPGVNDSKQLTEKKRLDLADIIKQQACAWVAVAVSPRRIDEKNIYQATVEAMCLVARELDPQPDLLLIDAVKIPGLDVAQYPIIKGDTLSISIACASIIAKVERDQMMQSYDLIYPGYGFASHKGYGTREHAAALKELGPSPIHRTSFEPVRSIVVGSGYTQPGLFD